MTNLTGMAFQLQRDVGQSLSEQLCTAIRQQAISGKWLPGTQLPPSRSFAVELGVSRSTVMTAFDQLIAEGYLHSRQGAGYTLTDIGGVELPSAPVEVSEAQVKPKRHHYRASQADMRLFPHKQWAKTIARICRNTPERLLDGGGLFGCLDLRHAIVDHLAQWRGMSVSAEQVIITAGATDALEMCIRALCQFGDGIVLEDPGYLPLRQLVCAMGMQPEYTTVDTQGTVLPDAQVGRACTLAVLTPSHQYPLGGAMSVQRRQQFINWAQQTGSWLIEDDYDSEFRYSGRPIPALAGLDKERTLYIGSFSKVFSAHLRLGYLVLPALLNVQFEQVIKTFSSKASYLPQPPLADYINSGDFYRHLRRVRRAYDGRRLYLANRLRLEFSAFGQVTDYQAGMQMVFMLNQDLSDVTIANTMLEQGFDIAALSTFYAQSKPLNGLLLGYSGINIEQLLEQLDRLQDALHALSLSISSK